MRIPKKYRPAVSGNFSVQVARQPLVMMLVLDVGQPVAA